MDTTRFVHLRNPKSDSNCGKARVFRGMFPDMLTPDFKGSIEDRMMQDDDYRLYRSVNGLELDFGTNLPDKVAATCQVFF